MSPEGQTDAERLAEYRLRRMESDLADIKQQVSALQLSINTTIGALTSQVHAIVEALPERYLTRRESDKIHQDLHERVDIVAKHLNGRIDDIEERQREVDARGWQIAAAMIAGVLSMIGTAFNLIAHHP